jgi:hypothetical protein
MAKVISHRDFIRDLGRGAVGEDVAAEFFRREFQVILKSVGETNRSWDFELEDIEPEALANKAANKKKLLSKFKKNLGETIEVKYDEAAAKYDNFFIEILFDVEAGKAGSITNCKADLLVWVVPKRRGNYKIYLFKRSEFIAWVLLYALENRKKLQLKSPAISPRARGIVIPVKDAADSFACLGDFDFKF